MSATNCEPVTLRDHLRVLRRRWWLLLLMITICVAGATAYAFLAKPSYEARVEMIVASDQGARSSVLAAAAPMLSMLGDPVSALVGGGLATQMQIIDSRPSLEDAWGVMHERPELLDRLLAHGLTEELLEKLPGMVDDLGEQPPPSRWPDEWQELLDTLRVAPVEESEIIEVRCASPDPERARDFANALVLAYIGRSLADARATTRRTRSYVEHQLVDVEVRLAEVEEDLRQFGERVGTVVLDESARQQIGLLVRLNEQAGVAESTLRARRALREELEAKLSTLDKRVVSSTVTRRNPEIVGLQGELARAEAERVSLLEEYAPQSMPVRRATAGVANLRERLRESAEEVVDSRQEALNPVAQEIEEQMIVAEGEEMAAQQSMDVLRGMAARVEGELSGLPTEQVALLKLQREMELLERFYLALKEKQQEFEIAERAKAPASRLVSHAIAADEPARPKKLLVIASGLMVGLLLGLLVIGLAEQLDERMQDPQQVAAALSVPVLGVLGRRWRGGGDENADDTLRSFRCHLGVLSRGIAGPDVLVLASHNCSEAAAAVADGLVRVAQDDGECAMVLTAERREDDAGIDLRDTLAPCADGDEARRRFAEAGLDLVVAVPPPGSGLLMATPLLEAGYPVALIVDMMRTSASAAQSIAELTKQHQTGPVVAIVTGGRRSSTCYLTPGTRT